MTRDPASQAAHERLESAVASMPAFDVDAGWSALVAQLEPPMAPVIPLRRRRPRRVIALGVAAALVVGGSAFAAVRHGSAPQLSVVPPVTAPGSGLVIGPHAHPAFSGAPATPDEGTDGGASVGSGASDPVPKPADASGETAGGSGGSDGSSGSGPFGGTPNQDAPDDTDNGSGNDGQHDDNGGGNDAGEDSDGQGSNGSGDGGSSQDPGEGDQGSNEQGSNDQGSNDQGGQGTGQ